MAAKRRSLAEIVAEDQKVEKPAESGKSPSSPKRRRSKTVATSARAAIAPRGSAPGHGRVARRAGGDKGGEIPKSEFIKMSITMPPDLFEALEGVSRTRRRNKEAHTMSAIVREAVEHWLSG